MNTKKLLIQAATALSLPLFTLAQDPADPGKASDAVKNPPTRTEGDRATAREINPTENERQFAGRITSVDRTENRITINDATRGSQVLHIGETTQMKRGNSAATWDDLKVGEAVQGLLREDGTQAHATSITIGK